MEPVFRHFLLRYLNFKGYKKKKILHPSRKKSDYLYRKKKLSGFQMSPSLDSNAEGVFKVVGRQ